VSNVIPYVLCRDTCYQLTFAPHIVATITQRATCQVCGEPFAAQAAPSWVMAVPINGGVIDADGFISGSFTFLKVHADCVQDVITEDTISQIYQQAHTL
jgi:hypothetical protein